MKVKQEITVATSVPVRWGEKVHGVRCAMTDEEIYHWRAVPYSHQYQLADDKGNPIVCDASEAKKLYHAITGKQYRKPAPLTYPPAPYGLTAFLGEDKFYITAQEYAVNPALTEARMRDREAVDEELFERVGYSFPKGTRGR